jgi:hypothetical protein
MTKKTLFVAVGIFLVSSGIVFAQTYKTSQTVTTNVGQPVGGIGNRPHIADTIILHLTKGSDGYFTKLNPNPFHYPGSSYLVSERPPNPPGNEDSTDSGYYYCTSLVIDTFNISGMQLPQSLGNVNTMIAYMSSAQGAHKGYRFLDYYAVKNNGTIAQKKALLSQVKPGDAIFFANTHYCGNVAYCHVGMVYSITINAAGDGVIETREANTPLTKKRIPISSWTLGGPWPDAGSFGGTNI